MRIKIGKLSSWRTSPNSEIIIVGFLVYLSFIFRIWRTVDVRLSESSLVVSVSVRRSLMDGLVMGFSDLVHDGVETVMFIGGVFDDTGRSVGFLEGIRALDYVTVAGFVGLLLISGMGIVDGIVERVFRMCLK